MKAKDKKKQAPDSKKKQLLNIFHQNVEFLQIFSLQQINFLSEKIHIFVFSRGNCLAKEKEYIDFVGVIAQGRAICKGKPLEIGDIIGYNQILGIQNVHQDSIIGESDGIIIAIRVIDLLTLQNNVLKNKIINRLMQLYANKKIKRQQIGKSIIQLQTIDEKKMMKLFTPQWTNFLSNEMDSKEKAKFHSYFPYYKIKQKDMVANNTSKPYLIILWDGQLIAKNKYDIKDNKVIQAGNMYNQEGFIFNQIPIENLYCLSNQAIVSIIDKNIFLQSFKNQTFKAFIKMVMNQIQVQYSKLEEINYNKEGKEQLQWSIFKKYPNVSILPLPKKVQNNKTIKVSNTGNDPNIHLTTYQTLFKQQLGINNDKIKTSTSQAQSGYQKLFTLKSQPAVKQLQNSNELQRLRKEVEILNGKLKFSEEMNKVNRLNLIQCQSRLNMQLIFKQISKFYSDGEIIGNKNQDQANISQLVTLKQAFDKQMVSNKVQMLVAKCAFKWLHITRKRKAQKPN